MNSDKIICIDDYRLDMWMTLVRIKMRVLCVSQGPVTGICHEYARAIAKLHSKTEAAFPGPDDYGVSRLSLSGGQLDPGKMLPCSHITFSWMLVLLTNCLPATVEC